jgi:hypothetical protein
MGKTGTTTLQHFFWRNRFRLAKSGIRYPAEGLWLGAGSHYFLVPYLPDGLSLKYVKKFWKASDWAESVSRYKEPLILVSSEFFSWAPPHAIEEFCSELLSYFDLRVVVYVRRQDEIIMSTYKQQLKVGLARWPLIDYLHEEISKFNYVDIIQPWAGVIEDKNIIVRPYEGDQLYLNDLKKDFLKKVLNVENTDGYGLEKYSANESFSTSAALFKLTIIQLFQDRMISNRFNYVLTEYSRKLLGNERRSKILSYSKRCEILDLLNDSNVEIGKKYLGRTDGELFFNTPSTNDIWYGDNLKIDDLRDILEFIAFKDPMLYRMLERTVDTEVDSNSGVKASAAKKLIDHFIYAPSTKINSGISRLLETSQKIGNRVRLIF